MGGNLHGDGEISAMYAIILDFYFFKQLALQILSFYRTLFD